MHISKFQVKNYKSFLESPEIELAQGINVIVGQNNAGKTALAEAMSLRFNNKPHRSVSTVPNRNKEVNSSIEIKVNFSLSRDELLEFLVNESPEFSIMVPPPRVQPTVQRADVEFNKFVESIGLKNDFFCLIRGSEIVESSFLNFGNVNRSKSIIKIRIDSLNFQFGLLENSILNVNTETSQKLDFAWNANRTFRGRVYMFRAERLNIDVMPIRNSKHLEADASNLAQVLNLLQTSNPRRFDIFNQYVSTIFPSIYGVTVPPYPRDETKVQIQVWGINPKTQRDDLAVPLSESGTGVGQVLAMLYLVLTSDFPRVIIIDEPQSFLHLSAVRKLIEIFKQHPQHQYIITTHSPSVISAANPSKIFLVSKEGSESQIRPINLGETEQVKGILAEVGARLSDVFGAENILWLEGPTEESVFPLIIERVLKRPLFGTKILGVVHTGDFESKQSKTVLEIYRRLSQGEGLLPPALGFIFDREGRTETQIDDLTRQGKGNVYFLPRRMYENYLLNPTAISTLMSKYADFSSAKITADDIQKWIEENRWNKKYLTGIDLKEGDDIDTWIREVRGELLLKDMFNHFSEARYPYEKVPYGLELTRWLCDNAPEDLREVADLIAKVLPPDNLG